MKASSTLFRRTYSLKSTNEPNTSDLNLHLFGSSSKIPRYLKPKEYSSIILDLISSPNVPPPRITMERELNPSFLKYFKAIKRKNLPVNIRPVSYTHLRAHETDSY